MPGQHALLSPSGSDRWMTCPGSIQAEAGFPNTTSVYAQEGTDAHELLEMSLRLGVEPAALATDTTPEDMVEAVGHALDYLRAHIAECETLGLPYEFHPEEKLEIDPDHGIWGTSDLIIVMPSVLVVTDYKHGQGVVVEPENNSQMMLYAAGARRKHGRRPTYKLAVVQPRARHARGPIREWSLTDDELTAFMERVHQAAIATLHGDAPRVAGSHCMWCRAAGACPTLREFALTRAIAEFAPVITPKAPPEGGELLAEALQATATVELWVKAVRAAALRILSSGGEVPGYKLVSGRRSRAWVNEAQVMDRLLKEGFPLDEIAPRSLVSPAGAERVVKTMNKIGVLVDATAFTDLITWKESAPTVAPENDPRPAVQQGSEFDDN